MTWFRLWRCRLGWHPKAERQHAVSEGKICWRCGRCGRIWPQPNVYHHD